MCHYESFKNHDPVLVLESLGDEVSQERHLRARVVGELEEGCALCVQTWVIVESAKVLRYTVYRYTGHKLFIFKL